MSILIPFGGTVNGSIPDYTIELNAIAASLGTIAATLATQATLNETKYWGTTALLVPGSPAASLAIIGAQLLAVNDNLKAVESKSTALNGTLGAIANSIAAQTQTLNAANVLTCMAVQDQIVNNTITRNETYAALGRNGIQIQPFPNIPELLKQNLAISTQFSISTNFLGSITSISNSLIQILINYLKASIPAVYAQAALDKLWAALGVNKLIASIAELDRKTQKAAQTLADTAARGGTYIPGISGGVSVPETISPGGG
jgi:hypothetical protein